MSWAASYDLLSVDCHLGSGWAHGVLCIHVLISEQFRNVLFKTELGWHTVHIKDPNNSFMHIFPTAGAFEVWFKYTLKFFSNFYIFWNRWHLSDTQRQNLLLTLEACVFVFVCVCMCWIEWGRECICVCVSVCVCVCVRAAFVMSTRYFFIFYFKTIAIRLRCYMPNFNLLLCFKAESMKILISYWIYVHNLNCSGGKHATIIYYSVFQIMLFI